MESRAGWLGRNGRNQANEGTADNTTKSMNYTHAMTVEDHEDNNGQPGITLGLWWLTCARVIAYYEKRDYEEGHHR